MAVQTTQQAEQPLWTYVPAQNYAVPEAPVEHQVRSGLAALWSRIRRRDPQAPGPAERQPSMPESLLQRLVPDPAWLEGLPALHDALEPWLETGGRKPALLLTAPHGGQEAVLRTWAGEKGWRVVEPPTPEQILNQDSQWLSGLDGKAPWVLPRLERCYLRNHDGLALVRRLLDAWTGGALAPGLAGCDRWAWAYLQHTWPGYVSTVLAQQALDHERLGLWFRALAHTETGPAARFRQDDTKGEVVPFPEAAPDAPGPSPFLRNLAAYSRGLPGVALALWRRSLLETPDAALTGAAASSEPPEYTVWVRPWNRLELPRLRPGAGRDEAFILHALLLHGGLSADLLTRLLPLSPHTVRQRLYALHDADLIEHTGGSVWLVSASGYPAVRQFLREHAYLTD